MKQKTHWLVCAHQFYNGEKVLAVFSDEATAIQHLKSIENTTGDIMAHGGVTLDIRQVPPTPARDNAREGE